MAILENCPQEFEAWPIALNVALGLAKALADTMGLLALPTLPEDKRSEMIKKTIDFARKDNKVQYVFYAFEKHPAIIEALSEELMAREDCGDSEYGIILRYLNLKSPIRPKAQCIVAMRMIASWENIAQVKSLGPDIVKLEEVQAAFDAKIEQLWQKEIAEATNAQTLGQQVRQWDSRSQLSAGIVTAAVNKIASLLNSVES